MLQRIRMEEPVFATIAEAINTPVPYEACGFLLGTHEGETVIVKQSCSVTNAAGQYISFAIADYERRRIERFSRRLGLNVVAVYHGHPAGTGQLSQADHRCLSYSKIPWIVIYPEQRVPDPQALFAAFTPPYGRSIPVEIVAFQGQVERNVGSEPPNIQNA